MSSYIDKLALILVRSRRQLVARSKGKSVFFTPGGKREGDESDEQALCRECKEELTVDLIRESIQPYGVFEAQAFGKAPGTSVRMTCYTADYVGTLQASEEVEELQWIQSSDCSPEKLTLAGKMILEDLKKKNLID
jgi:8-oxo-dGTP diphosphatase